MINVTWPDKPVVLDFEDIDVWMMSSYNCHLSQQQMYMYKKKPGETTLYYSCQALFPDKDLSSAALGVYAFTGADTVEAFFGCGKVGVWNRINKLKDSNMRAAMQDLGMNTLAAEKLLHQLEKFVVRIVYNDPVSQNLASARARKWRQSEKDDSARLPPDYDSFVQHYLRAHLQFYEWRHAHQVESLDPSEFGWHLENDELHPTMYELAALPDQLEYSASVCDFDVSSKDSDGDDDICIDESSDESTDEEDD